MRVLDSDDLGKFILRLTVGILLLFHGFNKLMHPDSLGWIGQQLNSVGLPAFIAYGVYIGEIIAPAMVVIGYKSRIGGAIIAINMLFAIGLVHMGDLFSRAGSGGYGLELDMFYLFIGLAVVFMGSGRFAARPD